MHGLFDHELLPFELQSLALLALIVRVSALGLRSQYPYFFWYLIVQALQLGLAFVPRKTTMYGYSYFLTEFIIVVFYALVVLEVYSLVFRGLTGIASLTRRYIRGALGAAIGISLLLVEVQPVPRNVLGAFFTFERTIVLSLLLFVFLITAFLAYFPVPLHRNVIFYSIGYSFYFGFRVAALVLANSDSEWKKSASGAAFYGSTVCLMFWAVALNREGERRVGVFAPRWQARHEAQVMGQLRSINESILRVRK